MHDAFVVRKSKIRTTYELIYLTVIDTLSVRQGHPFGGLWLEHEFSTVDSLLLQSKSEYGRRMPILVINRK